MNPSRWSSTKTKRGSKRGERCHTTPGEFVDFREALMGEILQRAKISDRDESVIFRSVDPAHARSSASRNQRTPVMPPADCEFPNLPDYRRISNSVVSGSVPLSAPRSACAPR